MTWSPAQQAAGKITGDIKCCLLRIRKTFLKIGELLVEVRDKKHYVTLNHKSLEDYVAEHFDMSRPTLYRYIKVYEWVLANRKEWLAEGAKIPDMSDVAGLVWIDQELAKKNLEPVRKTTLEALKQKATDGKLTEKELRDVQQRTNKRKPGTAKLLASLRAIRKRADREGATDRLKTAIERAIRVAENDLAVETAGFHMLDEWRGNRCLERCLRCNSRWA